MKLRWDAWNMHRYLLDAQKILTGRYALWYLDFKIR
jgi:hypothetical protein